MDLRRVHAADRPAWEVSLLPPCCSLADLQAHFSHFFPTLQAYSAVYVNYQRLRDRPIALQRHCVVTVLGMLPVEGLDTMLRDGTFAPLCFRGCDVAATRPGLARFLAFPSVPYDITSTSTTTTSVAAAAAAPAVSDDFFVVTVFEAAQGFRAICGGPDSDPTALFDRARRTLDLAADTSFRLLTHEIASLPSPQLVVCPPPGGPPRWPLSSISPLSAAIL